MALSPVFKIRTDATPAILELLSNTTLGTNGAKYRHLDLKQRIQEADDPLFLSMERNEKVLGNITFCRRGSFWYLRYFAFSPSLQAGAKKKSKGNSILKKELNVFFDEVLAGNYSDKPIESLYAYIDPRNDRSRWLSENFGFTVIANLVTQSYSRLNPKLSRRFSIIEEWHEIGSQMQKQYDNHRYFYIGHSEKPPFCCIKGSNNEILAFAKVTKVQWEIVRLPGSLGGVLTKVIPYIPLLNKLIKPKNHTFLVPEIVYARNNDAKLIDELFSSALAKEKCNLLLWWIDEKDPLYLSIKNKIKWGLLHKIIGLNPVNVVEKRAVNSESPNQNPIFVTAFDLV